MAFVWFLVAGAMVAQAGEVTIYNPLENEHYMDDADIAVDGTTEYTSGNIAVKVQSLTTVYDSETIAIGSEGDFGTTFDSPPGGWIPHSLTVSVWRQGVLIKGVGIIIEHNE